MNTSLGVTEKRSFEMDAERTGARTVAVVGARDRLAERIERAQGCIDWRGHGRRTVTGNAVTRHKAFDRRQALVGALHHIVTGTAVNVNVNESRSENGVAEIDDTRAPGNGSSRRDGQWP